MHAAFAAFKAAIRTHSKTPHKSNIVRRYTSSTKFRISSVRLVNAEDAKYSAIHLQLEAHALFVSLFTFDKADTLKIPLVWFRDHCRSPATYNHRTNQRRSNGASFFREALLADDRNPVEFDPDKQALTVHWLDGHESVFLAEEISNWAIFALKNYDECASRTLWDNQKLKEIPSVSSKSFDFAVFSRLLVRFGVVAVLGVEHRNEKATRKLCESIAPIQNTFFGDFWIFGADTEHKTSEEREDTAYGSDKIGPHTDGTYFDQTPGIQVFHCLKPAEEGGETVLVDGFAVAETLRTRHPEHFDLLSRMPVAHHYIEGGFDEPQEHVDIEEDVVPATKVDPNKRPLFARSIIHPVITLFKQKTVQIRYNPYDRAPLHSLYPESGSDSLEKTVKFYEAYEQLSRLVHEPQAALTVKLLPGTVLFIDNYRVLHGRTAYRGNRRMCGCYLSRDNLLAKARPVLSSAFIDV